MVLALSLLYRGTAIPLAGVSLPANRKKAWLPVILELFKTVAALIPARYDVLLLPDRGLYAPRLYRSLRQRHWHLLLRGNGQASFRRRQEGWRPIATLLPGPGHQWRGRGYFSKKHPLACTLVACWAPGQAEPWFLVTALPPQRAPAAGYGLRVVDVSSPTQPIAVGACELPGPAYGLALFGTLAYVTDLAGGLRIADVSNPVTPTAVGAYTALSNTRDVAISGTEAFVADGGTGLWLFDIADPTKPAVTWFYDTPASSYGITLCGNALCVADGWGGMLVLSRPTLQRAYLPLVLRGE